MNIALFLLLAYHKIKVNLYGSQPGDGMKDLYDPFATNLTVQHNVTNFKLKPEGK